MHSKIANLPGLMMALLLQSQLVGCSGGDHTLAQASNSQGPTWPIAQKVYTTAEQQVLPMDVPAGAAAISPANVSLYAPNGYSAWQPGPGLQHAVRAELAPAYRGSTQAAQLLSFFTISDIHIADKESPAQPIDVSLSNTPSPTQNLSSAYSPVILSTTQVLDAAVQTINALHKIAPFDFGISLGDDANNCQYNELRWFIDVMDGQIITPSSGANAGATNIDYQQPYQAAGLDKSISWYQCIGNHDQFWMGSVWEFAKTLTAHVSSVIINMSNNPNPASGGVNGSGFYMGVVNGTTAFGDIYGAGPNATFPIPPTVVADQNRHSLVSANSTTQNWMREFFNTASNPPGHGFTQANLDKDSACYSFFPKSDIPIKVIVLDDTYKVAGSTNYAQGTLDAARLRWLTDELQAGQDQDQLMIIAAHIPILPQNSLTDPTSFPQMWTDQVLENNVMQILHSYPNLLLWISGHRHINTVTPQPNNPNDLSDHPEQSFWEVETASLRDYPQQFRTFSIRRNSDNTISILITNVDPAVSGDSPAAKSRGYAIGAGRLFMEQPLTKTPSQAYNAELIKQLTPDMQIKIANSGTVLK